MSTRQLFSTAKLLPDRKQRNKSETSRTAKHLHLGAETGHLDGLVCARHDVTGLSASLASGCCDQQAAEVLLAWCDVGVVSPLY